MGYIEYQDEPRKKRRLWPAILCLVLAFILLVLTSLQLGAFYVEASWEYWSPSYAKEDIAPLLEKEDLTEAEYDKIYRQTGLTEIAVDDMRGSVLGRGKILMIQEKFFAPFQVKSRCFNPFTYMDEIYDGDGLAHTTLATLKDGDIIVSASTRVSWWRFGHSAIVIDSGAEYDMAECNPGAPGKKCKSSDFTILANFLVLRPKVSADIKTQVIDFVRSTLGQVPYSFVAGILTKKSPAELTSSQCSHYVWYAYNKFGVDLDSNGGGLVKPQDIARSEKVEVVQAYGFNLDTLWGMR